MPDVKRTLKIKTHQQINPEKDSGVPGYPSRKWTVEVHMVNENDGSLHPADCYEKAVYKLHPSFEDKAKQTFRQPPFRCAEEGWGEFDMTITLSVIGKGPDHSISHDLNFQQEDYDAQHKVSFKNPNATLLEALRKTGPVPGDTANGVTPGKDQAKKKGRKDKNVDMDKLAEGLQRLHEDDLLNVVQLVHEKKTPDTYTKNDVENGEFHVDLYTLPDGLVKELWDFTANKVDMSTL